MSERIKKMFLKKLHPQYILGLIDSGICEFKIYNIHNNYIFYIQFKLENIQLLYKIKEYFRNGKIINNNILKISSNFDYIFTFLLKNRLLNTEVQIQFLRWRWLYIKLKLENYSIDNKVKKRLGYFLKI